jgi:hypothetical protein
MYLLDTDILIDIERGLAPAVAWFSNLQQLPALPGFVVMELIQGSANAVQMQRILRLVDPLPVVWPAPADCERALVNFRTYHLSHNLGLLDSLIAACATGLSATLCTFNMKHYQIVPGLVIMKPYIR